ncbi:hypothetical protein [Massilibacteroides sp.]|uniref:hypothetical protein n=1 Tax=Massilibacteroides sp. TaxID=2034766 RepID=UPI0026102DAB|nr:hypothetical protein [Massilibacteroides sp.]MDD4516578.1 hypothetical protein [Massilibacteroides sp.]
MNKKVSRLALIVVVLTLVLIAVFSILSIRVGANPVNEFDSIYADYISIYNEEYRPVYEAYNSSLKAFAEEVKATSSAADLERYLTAIKELKTKDSLFWGDRNTPGTSRTDVPTKRTEMYTHFKNKEYAEAVQSANELIILIEERITHIKEMENAINALRPIPLSLTVTKINDWYSEFDITFENFSEDTVNWTLTLEVAGFQSLQNVWGVDIQGNVSFRITGNFIVISSDSYLFRKNEVLKFKGNCANADSAVIISATFKSKK